MSELDLHAKRALIREGMNYSAGCVARLKGLEALERRGKMNEINWARERWKVVRGFTEVRRYLMQATISLPLLFLPLELVDDFNNELGSGCESAVRARDLAQKSTLFFDWLKDRLVLYSVRVSFPVPVRHRPPKLGEISSRSSTRRAVKKVRRFLEENQFGLAHVVVGMLTVPFQGGRGYLDLFVVNYGRDRPEDRFLSQRSKSEDFLRSEISDCRCSLCLDHEEYWGLK